ncbi:hypothetical protein BH10BAC2_BH10BAC2_27060 [soil metagenome]
MPRDKNGKITYEMKSVGDAFQDHLEKHHNVSAVTPVWLDGSQKKPMPSKLKVKAKHQSLNDINCSAKQKNINTPTI